MVSTTEFVVVSRTLTPVMVLASSHTFTYALRPSGPKAMNCGGPTSIDGPCDRVRGRVHDGHHAGVTVGDVELPTCGCGGDVPWVSPTGMVAPIEGTGTAVAGGGGDAMADWVGEADGPPPGAVRPGGEGNDHPGHDRQQHQPDDRGA